MILTPVMFKDKGFITAFIKIAIPIALQNLFVSSLGIIDTLMVGQVGETAIAAVGLANQVFFLLNFTLFGITSGAAIFMAQYWGARDIAGIRKVMGMCLLLGFTACAFFSTIGGGLAVGIGLIVFFGRDLALSVYSLTRSGTQAASDVLAVLSFAVIFRAFNPTIIGGIWRSGGDTRFSAVLDTSAVWLVALPQAYLGAFVFYLPNQWVVACVLSEGLYKMIIGLFRVASKKWINNRIQPV